MGGAGRVWIRTVVVVVMAVLGCGLGDSASPSQKAAPAPSVDCISLISTMTDCLPFVSNGSTDTKPAGNCCNGLKTVLEADASCLCVAFKSSAQLGVVLNVTKATALPAACQVSAPSVAECGRLSFFFLV